MIIIKELFLDILGIKNLLLKTIFIYRSFKVLLFVLNICYTNNKDQNIYTREVGGVK